MRQIRSSWRSQVFVWWCVWKCVLSYSAFPTTLCQISVWLIPQIHRPDLPAALHVRKEKKRTSVNDFGGVHTLFVYLTDATSTTNCSRSPSVGILTLSSGLFYYFVGPSPISSFHDLQEIVDFSFKIYYGEFHFYIIKFLWKNSVYKFANFSLNEQ